ncbi:hypothetical protein RI367_006079 [Sorochytrium milnesiophthora]
MESAPATARPGSLAKRIVETALSVAPLGFLAFGGAPAVALLRQTFVVQKKWLDERLFAEFFALSQVLPGPGATEVMFAVAIHHGGLLAALAAFIFWSLPGLVIMTGLGLGVTRIPDPLPLWFVEVQNSVSAAAIGLVAQAAFAFTRTIVEDRATLATCTLAAAAVVLYPQPWLTPVMIAIGGVITFVVAVVVQWRARRRRAAETCTVANGAADEEEEEAERRSAELTHTIELDPVDASLEQPLPAHDESTVPTGYLPFSWRTALAVLCVWAALLILCLAVTKAVSNMRLLSVLVQFYVAGCIVFGGAPVVIPVLHAYVVTSGWVNSRDFLLGVALSQAMPGPNFNLSAYCGAVAMAAWGPAAAVGGALVGFVGIFTPGLLLTSAVLPLWSRIRSNGVVQKCLPGMNAAAVGLVFATAFQLWQEGIVRGSVSEPLGSRPYYVVVAGLSFVLVNAGVRAPFVMLMGFLGGLLGWGLHI